MHLTQKVIDERLAKFRTVCREQNLPLTPQRTAVFGALAGVTSHPTAQELYKSLKGKMPSLSLATVYKNLEKLAAIGLVRKITLSDGTAHWDADVSEHHHLINLTTGKVSDFFGLPKLQLPKLPKGVRLESASINFYVTSV